MNYVKIATEFSDVNCDSLYINPNNVIAFEEDAYGYYICLDNAVFGHRTIETDKDSIEKLKKSYQASQKILEIN